MLRSLSICLHLDINLLLLSYEAIKDSLGQISLIGIASHSKGNIILVTPNYKGYDERNEQVSEKIVAIYDKHAPEGTCGARYVLYTPIGHYVGYHKVMQRSPNGYGYTPVWDGGEYSKTPCFKTIDEARHYYYPQWY